MRPDDLDYDVSTQAGIARYHAEVLDAANDIEDWLSQYGEEHDLPPSVVANAAQVAGAQLAVSVHALMSDRAPRILDAVLEDEVTDFRLSLFKSAALHHPGRLSATLKRRIGFMDREVKRARQMPNAPVLGEA